MSEPSPAPRRALPPGKQLFAVRSTAPRRLLKVDESWQVQPPSKEARRRVAALLRLNRTPSSDSKQLLSPRTQRVEDIINEPPGP